MQYRSRTAKRIAVATSRPWTCDSHAPEGQKVVKARGSSEENQLDNNPVRSVAVPLAAPAISGAKGG